MDCDLRIDGPGQLALGAGPRVAYRLEVTWGADPGGGMAPLSLDLSGHGNLRFDFDFRDQGVNFNVVMFSGHGTSCWWGTSISPTWT